jgi:imidazolonepropionase
MPVLENIGNLIDCPAEVPSGHLLKVEDAALVWDNSRILWKGPRRDLPARFAQMQRVDAGRKLVIPGLIDCHTHLAFGGWRAKEFEMRALGRSYLEIARSGGGILSTVQATRVATEEELLSKCLGHLRAMVRLGVTTVECKSGYGLDKPTEFKLLRVYRRLKKCQPLKIVPTFLGAHAVPLEYQSDRQGYVQFLVEEMIPAVAAEALAGFCDVFVEESSFTRSEARRILEAGSACGLRPRVHADQLTDGGGAALAAETGASSADHLEFISQEGIRALARKDVVAVALPLASLYLGSKPMPARKLIAAGVKVALATDFNPGSAPSCHLPLAMSLGCTMLGMSPAEVLRAVTLHAAQAIEMQDSIGSLEPGKEADFVLIDAPDFTHWLYRLPPSTVAETYLGGVKVWDSSEGN